MWGTEIFIIFELMQLKITVTKARTAHSHVFRGTCSKQAVWNYRIKFVKRLGKQMNQIAIFEIFACDCICIVATFGIKERRRLAPTSHRMLKIFLFFDLHFLILSLFDRLANHIVRIAHSRTDTRCTAQYTHIHAGLAANDVFTFSI